MKTIMVNKFVINLIKFQKWELYTLVMSLFACPLSIGINAIIVNIYYQPIESPPWKLVYAEPIETAVRSLAIIQGMNIFMLYVIGKLINFRQWSHYFAFGFWRWTILYGLSCIVLADCLVCLPFVIFEFMFFRDVAPGGAGGY